MSPERQQGTTRKGTQGLRSLIKPDGIPFSRQANRSLYLDGRLPEENTA
jgi:hypothetical protein